VSSSPDNRIRTLEAQVARLTEFSQLLLNHLLKAQSFSGVGKGPTPENVNRWVIDLSNATWEKYQHRAKL
jgi:hypothetical protein